ncbi:MAG: hypothetical protein K6G79_01640 [Bacteroidales bacterium]|nr:hypothetical protein [Bacteroidales bacterium]
MKRAVFWIFPILAALAALPAMAQGPDDVLAKMNAVKRDTSCFYGIGNMATEQQAREEALLVLSDQLTPFLKENKFAMIRSMEDLKEGTIEFLTYSKRPGQYRVMAYVNKSALVEKDKEEVVVFQDTGKDAVEELLGSLLASQTQEEIERLLAGADIPYVHSGQLAPDTRQMYVDEGYLVYIDRHSGKVLEVMTPRDATGQRCDARSGASTSSMKYKRNPIYWVYVDGHQTKQ